jgi:hypothetical protein
MRVLSFETEVMRDAARALWRDGRARLRHGSAAPGFRERIWIRPGDVKWLLADAALDGVDSVERVAGSVRPGAWDRQLIPIEAWNKLVHLRRRFEQGKSWQEAGIIDRVLDKIARQGRVAGCTTPKDVAARYDRIDRIWAEITRTRRLRMPSELGKPAFRGAGLTLIHFGRDGRMIHRGGGGHRLCMAIIAGLDAMPAQVGFVHPEALPIWRDRLLAPEPSGHAPARVPRTAPLRPAEGSRR